MITTDKLSIMAINQTHPTLRVLTQQQAGEMSSSMWGQAFRLIHNLLDLPDSMSSRQVELFAIGFMTDLGMVYNQQHRTWDFDHLPNGILEAYIEIDRRADDVFSATVMIRDNIGPTAIQYLFQCSP
jgi:hypothetical protein